MREHKLDMDSPKVPADGDSSRRASCKFRPIVESTRTELWVHRGTALIQEARDDLMDAGGVSGHVEVLQSGSIFKLRVQVLHRTAPSARVDGDDASVSGSPPVSIYVSRVKATRRCAASAIRGAAARVCSGVDLSSGMFEVPWGGEHGDLLAFRSLFLAHEGSVAILGSGPLNFGPRVLRDSRVALGMVDGKDAKATRTGAAAPAGVGTRNLLGGGGSCNDGKQDEPGDLRRIQTQECYDRMCSTAWRSLGLLEHLPITCEQFVRALPKLGIDVTEPRALRLYYTCDLGHRGVIEMVDFELALMLHDYLPDPGLTLVDAFHFAYVATTSVLVHSSAAAAHYCGSDAESLQQRIGLCDARDLLENVMLEGDPKSKSKVDAVLRHLDDDAELRLTDVQELWTRLVDCGRELRKRGVQVSWRGSLRKQLLRQITDDDQRLVREYKTGRGVVERVRFEHRGKEDKRRRAAAGALNEIKRHARLVELSEKRMQATNVKRKQAAQVIQRARDADLGRAVAAMAIKAKKDANEAIRSTMRSAESAREAARAPGWNMLALGQHGLKECAPEVSGYGKYAENLASFTTVDLSRNLLKSVPEHFLWSLAAVCRLNLSSNRLLSMPEHIGFLSGTLERLDVSNNDLGNIDLCGELCRLRDLDASCNRIRCVPAEVGGCSVLTRLTLHSNALETVAEDLAAAWPNLEYLDLRGNNLDALPGSFGKLASLRDLSISSNHLRWIPGGNHAWGTIRHIDLNSNCLRELPLSSSCWLQVSCIKARGNALSELNAEGWSAAQVIDMGQNSIGSITPLIGGCTQLLSLSLDSNKLVKLPDELFLLTRLRRLDLARNNITLIPPGVGMLIVLDSLCLSGNQIKEICPEVAYLEALTALDVSCNRIALIPSEVFHLTSLTSLNASQNKIKSVPREILRLCNLRFVGLKSKYLTTVPENLSELQLIERLDLSSGESCLHRRTRPRSPRVHFTQGMQTGTLSGSEMLRDYVALSEAEQTGELQTCRGTM